MNELLIVLYVGVLSAVETIGHWHGFSWTAEPPYTRDDGFLSREAFLRDCAKAFSVPPINSEENPQVFSKKFVNIVDPLKQSNNLGRSISKGMFFPLFASGWSIMVVGIYHLFLNFLLSVIGLVCNLGSNMILTPLCVCVCFFFNKFVSIYVFYLTYRKNFLVLYSCFCASIAGLLFILSLLVALLHSDDDIQLNWTDPCAGNLGRIRKEFYFGACKLGKILQAPACFSANEINRFFRNTLSRADVPVSSPDDVLQAASDSASPGNKGVEGVSKGSSPNNSCDVLCNQFGYIKISDSNNALQNLVVDRPA